MSHLRQAIRAHIRQALQDVPQLGGRVSTTRTRPTQANELPCAIVYALDESAGYAGVSRSLRRSLSVAIEMRVAATDALDDVLDGYCLAVETAIGADPRLGGLALDSRLSSTTIGLDGEGETRQALATLTYRVDYFTP